MSTPAPIVLFVYHRPEHTRKTLAALAANDLAPQSTLYIFCDGPKDDTPGMIERIAKTRSVVRERQWCGEVIISESQVNKGLAASITTGVSEVVRRHGRVIVLEDDIVTSPGFLRYMNDALEVWKDEEKVMHISGYMYPLKLQMPETVFLKVVTPWGWATWERAWEKYRDDARQLLDELQRFPGFTQESYNSGYGREFFEQLVANAEGRLKTWAVKWHTVIYLKGGTCLHPGRSLTENIGFDGSGEHCAVDATAIVRQLNHSVKVEKIPINERPDVLRAFREFYLARQPKPAPQPSWFRMIRNYLKKRIAL